ncbi:hypothetical protein ACFSCW_02310 [Sphingomonas tabacisoli]|uniref:Uncharacterized protein n=1 Tax=Sphingomonas tabacisoli TaxID=2249466 RepID=A0ABW4HYD1_9SPHN
MRILTLAALLLATASPAIAQPAGKVVSIYRAAPGHLEALLDWLAKQDEASKAAGLGASQLYVHQDGASWDLLLIAPQTTAEQDRAVDAAAAKMGMTVGPRRSLELRQHIAEHTDTFAAGPTTAAEWLSRVRKP